MRKNKKGFTLIELLAVIVILAIIALITVPIVMNIISNSKKGSAEDSVYGVMDAAKLYWASNSINYDSDIVFTCNNEGKCTPEGSSEVLEISGTKPTGGTIVVTNGEVYVANLRTLCTAAVHGIDDE